MIGPRQAKSAYDIARFLGAQYALRLLLVVQSKVERDGLERREAYRQAQKDDRVNQPLQAAQLASRAVSQKQRFMDLFWQASTEYHERDRLARKAAATAP